MVRSHMGDHISNLAERAAVDMIAIVEVAERAPVAPKAVLWAPMAVAAVAEAVL